MNSAATGATPRIEQALAIEMVRSERRRALLLLGLFGILTGVVVSLALADKDALVLLTGKEGFRHLALGALTIVLAFEALMALYFHRLLTANREPSQGVLVAATVFETALPSVILAVVAGFLSPLDAFSAPPFLFYFLLLVLSPLRMQVGLCILTGAVAGIGYLTVALPQLADIAAIDPDSIFVRPQPHVAKAVILLIAGGLAAFVTKSIRERHRRELEVMGERQQVIDLFGQHVSPAVVDKLLSQETELDSETRRVCMMFLDIRSFTTFSEAHTPAEVVDFLNRLFEPLVDPVDQHRGIINKFLGDGFMAVFGAPMDDAEAELNACRASLAMLDEIQALRDAGAIPNLGIGIGLHAGPAMTGTVGSRGRKEYTIIGDTVNLAARIESLCKQFDASLLVSDVVWQAAGGALGETAEARAQEPVQVKGRHEPVVVWKLQ